jgi:hypothetical protein
MLITRFAKVNASPHPQVLTRKRKMAEKNENPVAVAAGFSFWTSGFFILDYIIIHFKQGYGHISI